MTNSYPVNVEIARYSHPNIGVKYYEQIISSGNGFRKVGLHSEGSYNAAVADKRSVPMVITDEVGNKLKCLLFAPTECEPFFQTPRIRELTGSANTYLLSIPLSLLKSTFENDLDALKEAIGKLPPGAVVIVEYFQENLEDDKEILEKASDEYGFLFDGRTLRYFKDQSERFSPDQDSTAEMLLYSLDIENSNQDTSKDNVSDLNILLEEEDNNGVTKKVVLYSDNNPMSQELIDDLWAISQVGFGKKLGESHPISMEVTKDFFESQLNSKEVYTTVTFINNEPVCFGSFALDLKHNPWINISNNSFNGYDGNVAHFFEVISSAEKSGFALELFQILLDKVGKIHAPCRIYFESTNVSKGYIPDIVKKAVEKSQQVVFAQIVKKSPKEEYYTTYIL